MIPLLTTEEKCLSVRMRARKKSVPAFVSVMQGHFPRHFNDVIFTARSISGQENTVSGTCVEGVLPNQSSLPALVIREATRYIFWLRYNPNAEVVFQDILNKTKNNWLKHQQAQSLIREVRYDTIKGVSAIIGLIWLGKGKCMDTLPNLNKLGEEIRLLIITPADETWKLLQRHVIYGFGLEVICRAGSLLESGSYDIRTESAIWLITFTAGGATSYHRLQLLTLYVMMDRPPNIKQLIVVNPHSGIYYTIDVATIPEGHLELISDCLNGTKEMLQRALRVLPFERNTVRPAVDFSLWRFMISQHGFKPYPYISYVLAVMGGAVSSGKPVEELIERLAIERVSIHETSHPSTLPGRQAEINAVLVTLATKNLAPIELVFILAAVETLLRWFNRVRYNTRLTSMMVEAPMFNNPADDTFRVKTNNQVAIVKLNYNPLRLEGADGLIRQQVKKDYQPGKIPKGGILKNAPLISIVNPLMEQALCYETRNLPGHVYDLITSLTFWRK